MLGQRFVAGLVHQQVGQGRALAGVHRAPDLATADDRGGIYAGECRAGTVPVGGAVLCVNDEGGQWCAVHDLGELAFAFMDGQLGTAQFGQVAAHAVVAQKAALVIEPGGAADREVLDASVGRRDFILEAAKWLMPFMAGNVFCQLFGGYALDGHVPAPLAFEVLGVAAQLFCGVAEKAGEAKVRVLLPKPVGRQVGKVGDLARTLLHQAFGMGVGFAQGGIGAVLLGDVGVGGHHAAIGQWPVHNGQHGPRGAGVFKVVGLAFAHPLHPAGHQGLQRFVVSGLAGVLRVAAQQGRHGLAQAGGIRGPANQLEEALVPHHEPQLWVEQGDALVDVVDGFVQPGQAGFDALAGMAEQLGQVGAGAWWLWRQCRRLLLTDLQQGGHAKAHDPCQWPHHVQRPGNGKTGQASARQVYAQVDAFAHGGGLPRFLCAHAVFVHLAARNALRYRVDAAQALALAGRHDVPVGIHEAAHQAQLCVQQVAELLGKGSVKLHGRGKNFLPQDVTAVPG